jgi:photosystem II stability/assembly factor-like uncharacterized protein
VNMKKSLLIMPLLALVLLGQGCFGGTNQAADGGSMWQTTDFGETWLHLKALPQVSGVGSVGGVNVTNFTIDPNNNAVYYMATEANGLFYTLDFGTTWLRPQDEEMRNGLITDIAVDPKASCTIFTVKGRRLFRSTDCARTFSVVYTDTNTQNLITAVEIDWFNGNVLWMSNTAGDILRSVDGGTSWSVRYSAGNPIVSLLVSNADSRVIMFGTADRGLYRTNDAGETWLTYQQGLNRDFRNSNRVISMTQNNDGSVTLMNTAFGILISTDGGFSWQALNIITDAARVRIRDVAVDPKRKERMYYTTDGNLFITDDGGNTWSSRDLPSARSPIIAQIHPNNQSLLLIGFRALEK